MEDGGQAARIDEGEKSRVENPGYRGGVGKAIKECGASICRRVAVKLHPLLEKEDPGSALQEAPWPELRTMLADLVRVRMRLE
jgi:hypothetical protein